MTEPFFVFGKFLRCNLFCFWKIYRGELWTIRPESNPLPRVWNADHAATSPDSPRIAPAGVFPVSVRAFLLQQYRGYFSSK